MNYTPKSGLNVPVITVLDDSGGVTADYALCEYARKEIDPTWQTVTYTMRSIH
jgi:hypothetical protein